MVFHVQAQTGVRRNNPRDFGQFFPGRGSEGCASGLEERIGHVHDQTAGGITGLKHRIQLGQQLSPQDGFFPFRFIGGCPGHFGVGLGFDEEVTAVPARARATARSVSDVSFACSALP